ncbi:MAG: 2-oxoacid:acceptor oxidoreductase subunit alpha [Gammaproteobacteria bacterium]
MAFDATILDSRPVSLALTGAGGSGALTAGRIFLRLAGRSGAYGVMRQSVGPQIRGGESAALMRIGKNPVESLDDRFDVLVAMDWMNVARFMDEMPLDRDSMIVYDPASGDVPEVLGATGARAFPIDLKAIAKSIPGGRANMVAVGVMAHLCGLPNDDMQGLLKSMLGHKGDEVVQASFDCFLAGRKAAEGTAIPAANTLETAMGERWYLSGNEASALGALYGGVRFVAAYPITPASDLLEWMTPRLEALGGCLVQAEDELASINMIVGASYGGVPALTATSGPGLSLMSEGIGLAVASETPVVVINVMRGGPSTGIPTKSEQSDLDQALHGLHGDAPHVVVASSSISDCMLVARWAARLAESLQTAVIMLTDQAMGQARAVVDPLPNYECSGERQTVIPGDEPYQRYAVTESGISPMALPGAPGGAYTADGLEHEPGGKPSTAASNHREQLDKRARKIAEHDYGWRCCTVESAGGGDGELAIITWGSTTLAAREAQERALAKGIPVRLILLRLLSPLPIKNIQDALNGVNKLLVLEQSRSRQFHRHLRAEMNLPEDTRCLCEPGPLPLMPGRILEEIESWN